MDILQYLKYKISTTAVQQASEPASQQLTECEGTPKLKQAALE